MHRRTHVWASVGWHALVVNVLSLNLLQQSEVTCIPFKNGGRQATHEGRVERMAVCCTANSQTPHKMPNVQPYVEVWTLPKPSLELACPSLTQQPQLTYIIQKTFTEVLKYDHLSSAEVIL